MMTLQPLMTVKVAVASAIAIAAMIWRKIAVVVAAVATQTL